MTLARELKVDGIQEQHQGECRGGHYLQSGIVDPHVNQRQSAWSGEEAETDEEHREGQRRPFHDAGQKCRDRENDRHESEAGE
jgi:hypothetical protein